MGDEELNNGVDAWAVLRLSAIGGLLASPPRRGELGPALRHLAERPYRHPTRPDEWVTFGMSTLERWYYQARGAADPIAALSRKVRMDAGQSRVMSAELLLALGQQYRRHRRWSYQLHFDNLAALVEEKPSLGPMVSYATVRRRMHQQGWERQRPLPRNPTDGQRQAVERLERREVRGYESQYVHGLWHSDFHEGKRRVVDRHGACFKPVLYAVLDDCSRLCCHAQWYAQEEARFHVHGFKQAVMKRGLPREYMTDRGKAMLAHEVRNGLLRLGITHAPTLPYSAYQNGKQESFWGPVEGRLMAMLEHVDPLPLDFLNRATQAWIELDYNRARHDELAMSPLERLLQGPDVSRPAPDSETLHVALCRQHQRTQRRSDGTITILGVRFEVPSRYRTVRRMQVRYRRWDLSVAYLVDERSGEVLARLYPQDKARNADGRRRALQPLETGQQTEAAGRDDEPLPPLMRRLLADYAATGLPPAYLPTDK